MRALVVLALVLAACGAAVPANTGIRGTVLAGPACPGPARLDSPCPDQPVAVKLLFLRNGTAQVASVMSGQDGRFKVDLPAGNYEVRGAGGLPFVRGMTVTVPVDGYVEVTLNADTGIR